MPSDNFPNKSKKNRKNKVPSVDSKDTQITNDVQTTPTRDHEVNDAHFSSEKRPLADDMSRPNPDTASEQIPGGSSRLAGYTIPKRKETIDLPSESDTSPFSDRSGRDSFDLGSDDSDYDDFVDVSDPEDTGSRSRAQRDVRRDNNNSTHNANGGQLRDGDFQMFDPVQVARPRANTLTDQQEDFLSKYFTTYINDEDIESSILDKNPIPKLDVLETLSLDSEVSDLISRRIRKDTIRKDSGLTLINRRIKATLGPVCELWRYLSTARREANINNSDAPSVDVHKILRHVEQTVICLGQATQSVDYQRRLSVLSHFVRDNKKCKDIVKSNDKVLKKNRKRLFGEAFYTALSKRARGSKRLRQAKYELFGNPQKRRRYNNERSQPFQEGPSQQGYGGRGGQYSGRKNNYGSDRGSRRGRGYSRGRGQSGTSGQKPEQRYVTPELLSRQPGESNSCRSRSNYLWRRYRYGYAHRYRYGKKFGISANSSPSAGGRKTDTFFVKLAGAHIRSSGTRHSARTSNRLALSTTGEFQSKGTKVFGVSDSRHRLRGTEVTRKKGHRNCQTSTRSDSKSCISSPKKRRRQETCVQFEKAQSVHQVPTLQDGRHSNCHRIDSVQRLYGKNRPQRRLLQHQNASERAQVPKVCLEGPAISISSSSIRLRSHTQGIHKTPQTSCSFSKEARDQSSDLPGRHDSISPKSDHIEISSKDCNKLATGTRLPDKLGKISFLTNSADGIPWFHDKLHQNATIIASAEIARSSESVQNSVEVGSVVSKKSCESLRQNDSSCESNSTSISAVSPFTAPQGAGLISGISELRNSNFTDPRMQSRASLVDSNSPRLERQVNIETQSRPTDNHRLFDGRLGGRVLEHHNTGPMDDSGRQASHKCPGNESCSVCGPGFHKRKNTCQSGQYYDSSLYQQDGRHKINQNVGSSQATMAILPVESDHTYCRASEGGGQSNSRQGIQSLHRLEQLEAEHSHIPPDRDSSMPDGNRPICRSNKHAEGEIYQLETGPLCHGNRRIYGPLGSSGRLCVSSILPDWQMSSQNQTGQGYDSDDHPSVANPSLVQRSSEPLDGRSSEITPNEQFVDITNRSVTSIDGIGNDISCMDAIRRNQTGENLSAAARKLLNKARRDSSKTTYETPWNKWLCWCDGKQIDPLQATVDNIIDFLADKFEYAPLQYATLNVYRSALSAYHPPIDGYKVGVHPKIKELMRGAFNEKPPQPRYPDTWNVDMVLKYLVSGKRNEELSQLDLTHKLAMLMALVSAGRSHEIHALKLPLMQDYGDRVEFSIDELTKSRRPGRANQKLTFMEYPENIKLDVLACLREYLKRTEPLRTSDDQKNKLFIACVKPHKPVVSCSVARWLKSVMLKAGVDIAKYKAHSLRGASTSKASGQGLSTQEIMDRANWSKAKTFYRFYHRDIIRRDVFQDKVLKLSD